MSSQITIKPEILDEAIKAVTKEYAHLKSDADRTLKIVNGETTESAEGSYFVSKFAVTTDALVKKTANVLQEINNYRESITIAKELLTGADKDAQEGISRSNVSGH